jgi:dihydroorotase-like cyclic amidohydrolase
MFDLIIRGGDVVTPEGVVRCDVAVAGETIAAIATPGALPADSAKQLIDATGHIVMPGGIDPHVHLHHVACGSERKIVHAFPCNLRALRLVSGTG